MLIAADNITTSRPSVRRAIEERDSRLLARMIKGLVRSGASWIDLNPGRAPADTWRFIVETAERACDLTLMIDSSDPPSMETALSFCTRPAVLNFATAEPDRLHPVLDLAERYDTTVIAATITSSVPPTPEQRISLASLIVEEASTRGIVGDRLVLDPMVMPLAQPSGEAHARAVIEFLRTLPSLFDPLPRTLVALSNLTARTATAAPFLSAAWGAGLDIALLNVLDPALMSVARLCEVFDDNRVYAEAEHDA
jgi:cobalamin-dependent methionine synthase I